MSYSINNSKKDVLSILKDSCENNPLKSDILDENISKNLENYGTNILEDNSALSVKECKIRLDNTVNLTNPITKNSDYEQILLDILMAEYIEKIGNLDAETIKILKLSINIYNEVSKIDKETEENLFDSEPNKKAIVSDKFLLKRIVRNKDNSLDIKKSANESIKNLIDELLNHTIPFKIVQSNQQLQKIIKIILDGNGNIYNFYNNEGNVICLSNNIIEKTKLIKSILESNIHSDYIDLQIFKHKFTNINLVNRNKFFYLTNIGDGDCLYIAIAKYLHILSHSNRDYPENDKLRKTAEHIRISSCKYMYANRYKYIDERGTIEDLVGNSNIWNSELNNEIQRFRLELPNLNESDFNNPTNIEFKNIKDSFNTNDDFTKYCIYMAQHNSKFSAYAGEIEIICISKMYNRNIFLLGNATDGSTEDNNKKLTHYKVIGGKSIVNTSKDLPIFLFLKNSQNGGSHYEILWPKKFGSPPNKNLNNKLEYAEDDNSRWENNVSTLKYVRNDNPNDNNNIELEMLDLENYYIKGASPMIIQLLPESVTLYENILNKQNSMEMDETPVNLNKSNEIPKKDIQNVIIEDSDIVTLNTDIVTEDIVIDKKKNESSNVSLNLENRPQLDSGQDGDKSIDTVIKNLETKKKELEIDSQLISNLIINKYPLEGYTKIGNYKYKNKYLFRAGRNILTIEGVAKNLQKLYLLDNSRPINIFENNGVKIIQNFNSNNQNDVKLLDKLILNKFIILDNINIIKTSNKKYRRRKRRKKN